MKRGASFSQSAPSLRAQTAPSRFRGDASLATSLPSIWAATNSVNSQGSSHEEAEVLLRDIKCHATIRGDSPPRPGSTGKLLSPSSTVLSPSSRAQTPYLMGGVSNAVELHNDSIEKADRRIRVTSDTEECGNNEDGGGGHASYISMPNHEQDFIRESDSVERILNDLRRVQENFEGGGGSPNRMSLRRAGSMRQSRDGDDDEDVFENIREKFELYKMCRKIEPELPPLVPLPRMMQERPETPNVDYNWSEEAVQKYVLPSRIEQYRQSRLHRENLQADAAWRRDHLLECSREVWSKTLTKKSRQAQDVILARREGAKATVPKDVVAEKWLGVWAMAAFLRNAKIAVAFSHLPAEEQSAKTRSKRALLEQAELLDEIDKDETKSGRVMLLTCMYRKRLQVKDKHGMAQCLMDSLTTWQKGAEIFLSFKRYMATVRYVQAWWRRTSAKLKDIRDSISRRWEKLERAEIARIHVLPHLPLPEMLDANLRNKFIKLELRAKRYFLLSEIDIWKQEAAHWQELEQAKKALGVKKEEDTNMGLIPHRPSYLPANHLFRELQGLMSCPEWCPGRRGDERIANWIKVARSNPKGYTKIPKLQNLKKRKGGKKNQREMFEVNAGSGEADHSEEAHDPARMFSEALADMTDDDLKEWGVDPLAMPTVGQKPGSHEGEGLYP